MSPRLALLASGLVGCANVPGGPVHALADLGPGGAWTPPSEEAAARQEELDALPDEEALPPGTVDLATLVDLALRDAPETRASWARAREVAEGVGIARAGGLPQVEVGAVAGTQRTQFSSTLVSERTDVGLTSDLTWLLFDSGGQTSRVAAAREALLAADFTHDDAQMAVILAVEEAYYGYLGARAQVAAAQAAVDEASSNLDAVTARADAGLGTLADVLQARTARSQAELALESAEGDAAVRAGALCVRVGLPPDAALEVGELPDTVDLDRSVTDVEGLLDEALARRPDVAAAAWAVAEARSRVHVARSEGLPSLSLAASYDPTWYLAPPDTTDPTWSLGHNYGAGLTLRVPLFQGGLVRHQVAAAKADLDLVEAQLLATAREAQLDAWTSAHAVITAAQRVRTARDLLASARQSEDVAQDRYGHGIASILELLAAQSTLASARAQDAAARADWLVAVARLAHDTGALAPTEAPR